MSETIIIGFLIILAFFILRANDGAKRKMVRIRKIHQLHKNIQTLTAVNQKIWTILQSPSQHLVIDLPEDASELFDDSEIIILRNITSTPHEEIVDLQYSVRSKIHEYTIIMNKLQEQINYK